MEQTNEPVGTPQPSAVAPMTYCIGDTTYRLEPASFAQHEWLAAGPLKGVDFGDGNTDAKLESIIRAHGPEILGMVLIAEGQTREQKAEAGLAEAQALGQRLTYQMTPSEVWGIARDFFTVDGFPNLLFFVDFPALAARIKAQTIAAASSPASVSLPMATAPGELPSADSADREMPSSISGEASNAAPSSGPCLVSAG